MELYKIVDFYDSNKLRVKAVTGETAIMPILTLGNSVSYPSKEWVENNKEFFLAVVMFEGSGTNSPFIVGFLPVQGANSSTYNVTELLLATCIQLLDVLTKAKVNTMIGPQLFMPDTQQLLSDIQDKLAAIQENILTLEK